MRTWFSCSSDEVPLPQGKTAVAALKAPTQLVYVGLQLAKLGQHLFRLRARKKTKKRVNHNDGDRVWEGIAGARWDYCCPIFR